MPPAVLIVLMGALGDLVRGLSIAVSIKEQAPGTKIGWVVEKRWLSVVELHPAIDEIFVFDRKAGLFGALKLWKELRRSSYDLTLDLQRHFKSGICSFASGAKRRIGFNRRNSKEGNFLFNTETIAPRDPLFPKLEHYFDFLESLGLKRPEQVKFGFEDLSPASLLKGREDLPGAPFIALVVGSSWESKDWPAAGYVQLGRHILDETKYKVVLVGGPDRIKEAELIVAGENRIQSLTGATTLTELFAVLKLARAAAGPDSGPGHIAAAVGTPYVSLFGPTPAERVAPHGMEDLAVTAPIACRPCYRRKCPGLDTLCMRLISPDAVWTRLSGLL